MKPPVENAVDVNTWGPGTVVWIRPILAVKDSNEFFTVVQRCPKVTYVGVDKRRYVQFSVLWQNGRYQTEYIVSRVVMKNLHEANRLYLRQEQLLP